MSSDATSPSVIVIKNLTKKFGDFKAVDAIDLEIKKSQVYGFLGPNGCGKSTAMRLMLGLLSPTDGKITVLGLQIPEQAEKLRRKAGYMTQKFSLYDDLTVKENLEFVAGIYGINNKKSRIQDLLKKYHLDERKNQRAGQMSGGQRQRLALAAAVLHKPELLILDEPTSAVDPESRRVFWEDLFDLADSGTTILASTHLMDEAERCHRVAILSAGKKVADGEPKTLKSQLDNRVFLLATEHARTLRSQLLQTPHVKSVSQVGNYLRVMMNDSDSNNLPHLEQALKEGDASIEKTAPTLEDVFVDVTMQSYRQ